MRLLIGSIFVISLLSGCASVAPYHRQFVSDPEMSMGNDTGKEFNKYIHSIREGATPAGSSKSSGGCGCN